jgi:hypothetical protein
MAGWGTGSFENDDAADWVKKLGAMAPEDLTQIFAHATVRAILKRQRPAWSLRRPRSSLP